MRPVAIILLAIWLLAAVASGQSFVNWETPHVSPLDLTPDGSRLLAVNTADNRLEVYDVTKTGLSHAGSVPVGLDPVSVRARTNGEAWVVNHVSDSVSIVDLAAMNVTASLHPGDEPADVVFAGTPERAFVTVSQLNQVKVYDPANLGAPPVTIEIEGEDPRALATDGSTVYAAIFESGNDTTSISEFVVSTPGLNPYPGAPNPPPNRRGRFSPPVASVLPAPPPTGLILEKDDGGVWRDDNGADWSLAVTWDLHDHDVALVDANTLATSYATGAMNLNMAIGIQPGAGVAVVGTEALNGVRFEPLINSIFVRVMGAVIDGPAAPALVLDLNPHLDYATPTVPQPTRDLSIGDPRGVAWTSAGDRGYVTGMGSNNVIALDAAWNRVALVEVGEGPTGVRIDETHDRVYVLNKFAGTISVIDAVALTETAQVAFYDPTPLVIVEGRPFLYDTHRTSGLGQASCGSCHVDGRMDQLAWDLGDPQGEPVEFDFFCFNLTAGADCEDWHPMKGPLVTQTLVGISNTQPFHWRGDRGELADFNPAFEGLQGDDAQLTPEEMDQFTAFIDGLAPPPNPFRAVDGTLSAGLPDGSSPAAGRAMFVANGTGPLFRCVDCHDDPAGTNASVVQANLIDMSQSMNTPTLLNIYEKTGRDDMSLNNNRGFGFIHDGSFDRVEKFFDHEDFTLTDDEKRDLEAYLMSFSDRTHAGVGVQRTLPDGAPGAPASLSELIAIASTGDVDLVARGLVAGQPRGYYLLDTMTFQSDRVSEQIGAAALAALAAPGAEITFTLVPAGSAIRIGVDRDADGVLDGDERDQGTDPADPDDVPAPLPGDVNGDWTVNVADLLALLGAWGDCPADPAPCPADLDDDGQVSVTDLLLLLPNWS